MKLNAYYDTAMKILHNLASNEDAAPGTRIQAAQALAQLAQSGPPHEYESEKVAEEKKAPTKKVDEKKAP